MSLHSGMSQVGSVFSKHVNKFWSWLRLFYKNNLGLFFFFFFCQNQDLGSYKIVLIFSWFIFFQHVTEPEIDIGKNSHCDRAERFKDLGMFVPQKKCVPCQTFSRNAEIMRHIAYPKWVFLSTRHNNLLPFRKLSLNTFKNI